VREKIEKYIQLCKKSDKTPVVIFGSSVNGLSYVRSLGRKKVPVLCLDNTSGPAAKSRFGIFILLEILKKEPVRGETVADTVLNILNQEKIKPVVLGSADEWQVYIAKRSESNRPSFISFAPAYKTMETIIDKQAQYELASGLGISVPAFANAGAVLEGKVSWNRFPSIIKPRWAHIGRGAIGGKALLVNSAEALQAKLNSMQLTAEVTDYIVQQVIEGTDNCLYSYLGLFEPAGYEFVGMIKRKLRQYPPFLGDGSFDVTCTDTQLTEAAKKLLSAIDYQGLVGVEFKRNSDSDGFGLIEINPRTVSTNQLAIRAGVDFPWLAYQIAVNREYPELMPRPHITEGYKVDYHHVNEERDFKSFLIRKRNKEIGFFEWLKSVLSAKSYALWDKGDPRPFFNMVLSKSVSGIRKIASKK